MIQDALRWALLAAAGMHDGRSNRSGCSTADTWPANVSTALLSRLATADRSWYVSAVCKTVAALLNEGRLDAPGFRRLWYVIKEDVSARSHGGVAWTPAVFIDVLCGLLDIFEASCGAGCFLKNVKYRLEEVCFAMTWGFPFRQANGLTSQLQRVFRRIAFNPRRRSLLSSEAIAMASHVRSALLRCTRLTIGLEFLRATTRHDFIATAREMTVEQRPSSPRAVELLKMLHSLSEELQQHGYGVRDLLELAEVHPCALCLVFRKDSVEDRLCLEERALSLRSVKENFVPCKLPCFLLSDALSGYQYTMMAEDLRDNISDCGAPAAFDRSSGGRAALAALATLVRQLSEFERQFGCLSTRRQLHEMETKVQAFVDIRLLLDGFGCVNDTLVAVGSDLFLRFCESELDQGTHNLGLTLLFAVSWCPTPEGTTSTIAKTKWAVLARLAIDDTALVRVVARNALGRTDVHYEVPERFPRVLHTAFTPVNDSAPVEIAVTLQLLRKCAECDSRAVFILASEVVSLAEEYMDHPIVFVREQAAMLFAAVAFGDGVSIADRERALRHFTGVASTPQPHETSAQIMTVDGQCISSPALSGSDQPIEMFTDLASHALSIDGSQCMRLDIQEMVSLAMLTLRALQQWGPSLTDDGYDHVTAFYCSETFLDVWCSLTEPADIAEAETILLEHTRRTVAYCMHARALPFAEMVHGSANSDARAAATGLMLHAVFSAMPACMHAVKDPSHVVGDHVDLEVMLPSADQRWTPPVADAGDERLNVYVLLALIVVSSRENKLPVSLPVIFQTVDFGSVESLDPSLAACIFSTVRFRKIVKYFSAHAVHLISRMHEDIRNSPKEFKYADTLAGDKYLQIQRDVQVWLRNWHAMTELCRHCDLSPFSNFAALDEISNLVKSFEPSQPPKKWNELCNQVLTGYLVRFLLRAVLGAVARSQPVNWSLLLCRAWTCSQERLAAVQAASRVVFLDEWLYAKIAAAEDESSDVRVDSSPLESDDVTNSSSSIAPPAPKQHRTEPTKPQEAARILASPSCVLLPGLETVESVQRDAVQLAALRPHVETFMDARSRAMEAAPVDP